MVFLLNYMLFNKEVLYLKFYIKNKKLIAEVICDDNGQQFSTNSIPSEFLLDSYSAIMNALNPRVYIHFLLMHYS